MHVTHVQLENKYLRLPMAVTLGSRFGEWRVCWLGGWTRHRMCFLVMLVRVTAASTCSQDNASN